MKINAIAALSLIAVAWLASAPFVYAWVFAYYQKRWPSLAANDYRTDWWFAVTMGVLGPVGLLVVLTSNLREYGMKWR